MWTEKKWSWLPWNYIKFDHDDSGVHWKKTIFSFGNSICEIIQSDGIHIFNWKTSRQTLQRRSQRRQSLACCCFFLLLVWKIKRKPDVVRIIVLRAGRAPSCCRPPDCLPTQEEDEQGECKRGRRLSVTTRSSPWGTTSPHGCCSTPATTRQREKRDKKQSKTHQQVQVPAGRRSYVKHAVHIGLGDVSQLLGQPGLHGTPLHLVAAGEQVQQQPAVLHTRHTFQQF